MLLSELEIKNYRSLEAVQLDGLAKFNVLIGRNNAGKSSIFGAVLRLTDHIFGRSIPFPSLLTDKEENRSIELRLRFSLSEAEREGPISQICSHERWRPRRPDLMKSPLFRQIEYHFKSPVRQQFIHLQGVKARDEANSWWEVDRLVGNESSNTPRSRGISLTGLSTHAQPRTIDRTAFSLESSGSFEYEVQFNFGNQLSPADPNHWARFLLVDYLRKAFFFQPFRHSAASMQVQSPVTLAQDGSNLSPVLHALRVGSRRVFDRIEKFVQSALPDLGLVETPITSGTSTEIAITRPDSEIPVRLHDMGSGIEQLLMVAVVLNTTGDDCPLFLEEPESHLHPGAQRFLVEKLLAGNRQVFISTHSPSFLNLPFPHSLYHLTNKGGRTSVRRVQKDDLTDSVQHDLGLRNSDILLSNGIIFVEGESDRGVWPALGNLLSASFAERNLICVEMNGGAYLSQARLRSDILDKVSQRTSVPHLFIFDRDERPNEEVVAITRTLGGRAIFLTRREIENYFLIPSVLREAARQKLRDGNQDSDVVDRVSDDDVRSAMNGEASKLYGLVLLNRIRSRLPQFGGGVFPRELAAKLSAEARAEDLAAQIESAIRNRLEGYLGGLGLEKLVKLERETLAAEWTDVNRRLELAPGEEIVEAVFQLFGLNYAKPSDTHRIARCLRPDEVDAELRSIVSHIATLVPA
jgi:predicted ATPase